MALPVLGSELIQLDKGTYMWVQMVRFGINPHLDDRSVLRELITSPGYANDHASPYAPGEPAEDGQPVHGRWHLQAISDDSFRPCSSQVAATTLLHWAQDQDWGQPGYRQPPEVMARLDPVLDLFARGPVYRLDNPDAEHEHSYGFVVGSNGFCEFVVFERESGLLHLIIAADD